MGIPSRRTFLAVSAGGLLTLQRTALASVHSHTPGLPALAPIDFSNALNLRLFLRDREAFGLAGVMSMRPVRGELGRYPRTSLLLFPFKREASSPHVQAFLPGRSVTGRPIATVPMTTAGLSPDEYFCRYVLKAPWQSFIGFALGATFAAGPDKRPWHSNVAIGSDTVGIHWTSPNLNHPWFAGSRWIPDNDHGSVWRARIIDGVHRAAAMMC